MWQMSPVYTCFGLVTLPNPTGRKCIDHYQRSGKLIHFNCIIALFGVIPASFFFPVGGFCSLGTLPSRWLILFKLVALSLLHCPHHCSLLLAWSDCIAVFICFSLYFILFYFWKMLENINKQILDTHKKVGINLLNYWLLLAAEGSWRHTDKTCNVCGFSSQLPTLSKPQRHSPKLLNFQSTLSSPSILQVTGYKEGSTIR